MYPSLREPTSGSLYTVAAITSEPIWGESLGAWVSSSPWSTAGPTTPELAAAAEAEPAAGEPLLAAERLHAGAGEQSARRRAKAMRRGKRAVSYPSPTVASTPT